MLGGYYSPDSHIAFKCFRSQELQEKTSQLDSQLLKLVTAWQYFGHWF